MIFMLPTACFSSFMVRVFYLSVACIIIARLLLIPCMLVTSLLHVILVVCTHYFSRMYQSSLFFVHGFPPHPCFHTVHLNASTASCTAILHLHSPWIHPSNVYTPPPFLLASFPLFCLLRVIISILCVDWTGELNVLVCSFFYDGQCMFPITYHVCFSIAISNLLFPVICIIMSS